MTGKIRKNSRRKIDLYLPCSQNLNWPLRPSTLGKNEFKPTKKEEVSRFHICFSLFSGNYVGKTIFEVTKCLLEKKKKNPKPGKILAFS